MVLSSVRKDHDGAESWMRTGRKTTSIVKPIRRNKESPKPPLYSWMIERNGHSCEVSTYSTLPCFRPVVHRASCHSFQQDPSNPNTRCPLKGIAREIDWLKRPSYYTSNQKVCKHHFNPQSSIPPPT